MEGLINCPELEELYVSDQRLKGKIMTFDMDSMAVISSRMKIIEAENCNIQDATPLAYLSITHSLINLPINLNLDELEILKLQGNNIEKFEV